MPFTDHAIFMEAVTGDNGVHTAPEWWLSPDLTITGPDTMGRATPGTATTPIHNNIQVRVHRKSDASLSTDVILVDVYVCDPSLTITPVSNSRKLSNATGRPNAFFDLTAGTPAALNPGGSAILNLDWSLPLFASGPESPGHKCLVARAYPDTDTPPASTFDAPANQHVVQHNICIIPCGSPCGQEILTTNLAKVDDTILIRATADIEPNKHVLKSVTRFLKGAPGFKRLITGKSLPFQLEFSKKLVVETKSRTEKPTKLGNYGRLKVPNFEAKVVLKKRQTISFRFTTDLEDAKYGDAFIFHVTHTNSKGQVEGGCTVVAVRTPNGKW